MAVGTFDQPNYETAADGTTYKRQIDNSVKAMAPFGGAFAPHEQNSANLTIRVDSGQMLISGSLFLLGVQDTPTGSMGAPSANPRRDIIAISLATGSLTVINGAEAASPADPAVTSGYFPVARVAMTVGMTQIANTSITDLRPHHVIPSAAAAAFVPTEATEAQAPASIVNSVFLSPRRGLSRDAGFSTIAASHTIVSSARGQLLNLSNGSGSTLTLPNVSLMAGFQFTVAQVASGQYTFTAQSGTTLRSYGSATKTAGLYAAATVVFHSPNSGDWFVAGNISA